MCVFSLPYTSPSATARAQEKPCASEPAGLFVSSCHVQGPSRLADLCVTSDDGLMAASLPPGQQSKQSLEPFKPPRVSPADANRSHMARIQGPASGVLPGARTRTRTHAHSGFPPPLITVPHGRELKEICTVRSDIKGLSVQ